MRKGNGGCKTNPTKKDYTNKTIMLPVLKPKGIEEQWGISGK